MSETIERGISAHTPSSSQTLLDEQLPFHVREHVQRLKLIAPVISVSIMALRRQNAELDEDIASVLHHSASNPLDEEIDTLETLLHALAEHRASAVPA